jgi:hypothetical protein
MGTGRAETCQPPTHPLGYDQGSQPGHSRPTAHIKHPCVVHASAGCRDQTYVPADHTHHRARHACAAQLAGPSHPCGPPITIHTPHDAPVPGCKARHSNAWHSPLLTQCIGQDPCCKHYCKAGGCTAAVPRVTPWHPLLSPVRPGAAMLLLPQMYGQRGSCPHWPAAICLMVCEPWFTHPPTHQHTLHGHRAHV